MFDNNMFVHRHTTSNSVASNSYFRVPYKCTVLDLKVWCQADPGDGGVVTLKKGTTDIGTGTFESSLSAGDAAGAYVPDF